MFLARSAEYALRIMAIIAARQRTAPGSERFIRAKDIVEEANVPLAYLQKVLKKMVEAKLLLSERGHRGGFKLRRPPQEISFADILSAIQPKRRNTPCVFGLRACNAAAPCVLHHQYSVLKTSFQEWSEDTTLESIDSPLPRPASRHTRTRAPRLKRKR